jgi:Flp pilus assembly protein TadD
MGAFSPVALTNILKRVANESCTGELQVVSGNWIKSVRVDDGAIRFAKSNMREDRLGESMLAHECISRSDYHLASERMAADGCRFGEALLKMGRLDRNKLHRELGVQVQRIVLSLFRIREGLYSFEQAGPYETRLPFSLPVPPLLLKGLRRIDDGRLILSALPPADTFVRIAQKPTYNLELAKLAALERSVLEKAGYGATIGSIVRDASLDRSSAMRACYALLTLGLLEVEPERRDDDVAPNDATRELIGAQFNALESTSEEDLLGIEREASEGVLRDAYEALCSEWTEVRQQTHDPALVEQIDAIEFRLAAAYHQLLVERERVSETLAAETAAQNEHEDVSRRARIEQLERDAKLHLQVKDWSGAISLLHELVALAPENAEFQLMMGQAMQVHPTLKAAAEEHFLQAVSLAPDNARAHLALGRYYQRAKKHARAIVELERALELDPGNEDAKRYLQAGRQPTRMTQLFKKIFR